jgi:hypothetical protein
LLPSQRFNSIFRKSLKYESQSTDETLSKPSFIALLNSVTLFGVWVLIIDFHCEKHSSIAVNCGEYGGRKTMSAHVPQLKF